LGGIGVAPLFAASYAYVHFIFPVFLFTKKSLKKKLFFEKIKESLYMKRKHCA